MRTNSVMGFSWPPRPLYCEIFRLCNGRHDGDVNKARRPVPDLSSFLPYGIKRYGI